MPTKLYREHEAEAAMLAYRTGLSAAICKAWLEATTVNSANAPQAAIDSDHNSIIATRYKIEAYALARSKKYNRGESWPGIERG
jgi:hypothetical protein